MAADRSTYIRDWQAREGHRYKPGQVVDPTTGRPWCVVCGRGRRSFLHEEADDA